MNSSLQNLKAKLAAQKLEYEIHSQNLSPTSLHTLVTIYNKATYDCCINYMDGFKALVSYLTTNGKCPIGIPNIDTYSTDGYIPSLLNSYELGEMAVILNPSPVFMKPEEFTEKLGKINQTKKAILDTIYKDIV